MSRFLSTKYLRFMPSAAAGPIDSDRPCESCGYNLRGLPTGGRCPECGHPIQRVGSTMRDALCDAGLQDIRRLRVGLMVAMACLPLLVIAPLALTRVQPARQLLGPVMMIASGVWCLSVWLTTPVLNTAEGRRRGFATTSRLRAATRWLQLGWPVAWLIMGFLVAAPRWGAAVPLSNAALVGLAILAALVAVAGLGLQSMLLRRLAEWCYNDFAGRMFEYTMWMLAGVGVFGFIALVPPLRGSVCLASAAGGAGLIAFLLGLASITGSVRWSLRHARQHAERERRVRDSLSGSTAATIPDDDSGEVPVE